MISGARVLDLFAGSGALGFESLSRGASHVLFVESARPAVQLIEANARELGVVEIVEILGASLERVKAELARRGPFDIVLADPPYAGGWEMKLLETIPWEELLTPGGHFCLEWGAQKSKLAQLPERAGPLVKVREKNYGDSLLTTYERAASDNETSNLSGFL